MEPLRSELRQFLAQRPSPPPPPSCVHTTTFQATSISLPTGAGADAFPELHERHYLTLPATPWFLIPPEPAKSLFPQGLSGYS